MAADGSKGPRPYTQRQARTVFVRVPALDWPMVKRGYKTEFRGSIGKQSALFATPTPSPCVAYSIIRGSHDCRLMLLESISREPLGVIGPESLEREGFTSLAEYRRYWMRREGKKFQPTKEVFVYQLRPLHADEHSEMGAILFNRLYGEFVDA